MYASAPALIKHITLTWTALKTLRFICKQHTNMSDTGLFPHFEVKASPEGNSVSSLCTAQYKAHQSARDLIRIPGGTIQWGVSPSLWCHSDSRSRMLALRQNQEQPATAHKHISLQWFAPMLLVFQGWRVQLVRRHKVSIRLIGNKFAIY